LFCGFYNPHTDSCNGIGKRWRDRQLHEANLCLCSSQAVSHLLSADLPTWVHYGYSGLFAILGAVVDQTFHNLGLRPYAPWCRS